MNLNELKDKAYQCAIAHCFHEEEHSDEHYIFLVISELMEAVEADRKGKKPAIEQFNCGVSYPKNNFKQVYDCCIKGTVAEELADACIRLLDLAGLRKINVEIPDDTWNEIVKDLRPDAKSQYSFSETMFHICENITDKYKHDNIGDVILSSIVLIKIVCHVYDIDLDWHIKMKMKYNEMRENKHGKRY